MESEEPKNVHKKGNLYGGLGNKPMKNSAMSNSQNIDFYETDLLDIVNSIQPWASSINSSSIFINKLNT